MSELGFAYSLQQPLGKFGATSIEFGVMSICRLMDFVFVTRGWICKLSRYFGTKASVTGVEQQRISWRFISATKHR
jgi:hypothetical protein